MSEATQNAINLSDFEEPFAEGEVVFDPNATASGPPPVPENSSGYIGNLHFAKEDVGLALQWEKRIDKGGNAISLQTALVFEITMGDSEGRKIRQSFVNTEPSKFDQTTEVNKICQALGEGVSAEEVALHGPHKAQAIKLCETLGTMGATIKAIVQWQAKFLVEGESGKKESLRGEDGKVIMLKGATKSSWPKDALGNPKSHFTLGEAFPKYADTDYAGVQARVDNVIVRWAPAV